jgi:RHS repeat-associated protein
VLANEQSNGLGANVEEFRNDPLGNVLYRRTRRTAGTNDAPFTNQYSPVGELMTSYSHLSSTPGQNERADTLKLTFGGQQLIRESQMVQNPNDGSVDLELATRHYFGADDKLMAVQRYSWRSSSFRDGTWEEYWYDALGRRVLTRARRDPNSIYDALTSGPLCMGGIQCRSFTERVWWDGNQALVEERTAEGTSDVSNSGLVGNIHGLTLDEPLAVITDQTRIINYNWRGQGESSVFPNGQAGDASLGNSATEIDWPALSQAQTYFTPGPGAGGSNPKRWMGTFVANGQGTTGMLYRRNRYFSPVSGQFTQSDPIGIAGGMNAFGFAEGDPVNFSDPFGLCPWTDCLSQALADWGARRGGTSGTIALNAGAALNAGLDASGINFAAEAGDRIGKGEFATGGIELAMTFVPVGRVARASSPLIRGAAEALASRIERSSVTVALERGFKRVDLIGGAHAGIPTPHVHLFEVHTNPATGESNLKKTFLGPATRQDIVDAARAAGH